MSESSYSPIDQQVRVLLERGVAIPCPGSIEIGPDVSPDAIAPGVVIHTGCKILGAKTSMGPNCVIGEEAPTTIENCQLGEGVSLKGGFFSGSVFLDGANMGSGAQVRAGTLLEEEANGAHTVGLKQTVLLPFVTLGSLINFCDCLMAGGTSRKNHSEVGSSYIHFNFTPHGDKATPSLIGDVPRGVMLDQPPIFLGGQGGLVGPARIEYGCVLPAGFVCRGNVLERGHLWVPRPQPSMLSKPYHMGVYQDIKRMVANNLIYIGNMQALREWYRFARSRTMGSNAFTRACYYGALEVIDTIIAERIKRLAVVAEKLVYSAEWHDKRSATDSTSRLVGQQKGFIEQWPHIEESLRHGPEAGAGEADREAFLREWELIDKTTPHTKALKNISTEARAHGVDWLQTIVDSAASRWIST